MVKGAPGNCRYNVLWKSAHPWSEAIEGDVHSCNCTFCKKAISVSQMGIAALKSHEKGKKHLELVRAAGTSLNVQEMMTTRSQGNPAQGPQATSFNCIEQPNQPNSGGGSTDSTTTTCTNGAITSSTVGSSSDSNNNVMSRAKGVKFFKSDLVTKAEILFCLQAALKHMSLRDVESNVVVAKLAFGDSQTAQGMSLGKDKASYMQTFGLGPFFEKELRNILESCTEVALAFDESLNKVSNKKQLDVHVKFWDFKVDRVATRYLTSAFLLKATAADLLTAFKENINLEILLKVIQLSMDGPNVNFTFLKNFQDLVNEHISSKLLNLGSCGVHVVHNSFKAGAKATKWQISDFLYASYNYFLKSPARRATYIMLTGSEKFPKKYCGVRWCENKIVLQRAREILPNLKIFVDAFANDKSVNQSKSFQIMQTAVNDPFFDAKLAFLESLACDVEPFLTAFQTNWPLAPFLYSELFLIVSTQLKKFLTEDALQTAKDLNKITTVLKDKKNLVASKKVDVGFSVRHALRQIKSKTVTELQILHFKNDCRQCLMSVVLKLMERSPLKQPVVKAITCLDPAIVMNKKTAERRITSCLEILVQSERLSASQSERVKSEFVKVISNQSVVQMCKKFDRAKERLDDFWMKILKIDSSKNDNLSVFVRKVLICFHGNADPERGFSINGECVVENQKERSLIAQRMIYAALEAAGGIESIEITKPMINAVLLSHSRYKKALKEQKQKLEADSRSQFEEKQKKASIRALESQKVSLMQQWSIIDEQLDALKK